MKIIAIAGFLVSFIFFSCTSKINFSEPDVVPPAIQTSDIIISEISTSINTDANAAGTRPHYVELYNGTSAPIDLSNYAIGYHATTDANTLADWSFPTTKYIQLIGLLASGKCFVIASPTADKNSMKRDSTWGTTSTASADASNPLQLSGNSAIALLKKDVAGKYSLGGVKYKLLDAFGSPNVARVVFGGTASSRNNFMWTISGETTDTRNRTFWRKSAVKDPNADWSFTKGTTATDSQWILSGDKAWVYTNLGLPSQKI
jgi:hypothetical protein